MYHTVIKLSHVLCLTSTDGTQMIGLMGTACVQTCGFFVGN